MVERDFTEVRNCVENALSTVENLAMFLNRDEIEKQFSNLRAYIEEYCVMEARQNVIVQALEKAKAETNLTNLESLQERYKNHLSEIAGGLQGIKHHPYMLALNKRIQRARQMDSQNLDDSDLTITDTQDQFIDPITKKPILDPVKNTVCGHIYERETILELIKTRKKIKCPVMGCGNWKALTALDIVSDDELRYRLELTQQQHLALVSDRSVNNLDTSIL